MMDDRPVSKGMGQPAVRLIARGRHLISFTTGPPPFRSFGRRRGSDIIGEAKP